MKLTLNEKNVLENIATSEWTEVNGAEPENADETLGFYYTEYLSGDLTDAQVKGVVTNLVKKGLVDVQDNDDEDNYISLTEKGFDVYKGVK